MSGRGTVALMPTCLVDLVRPEAGVAAVRVLRRAGYRVTFPSGQTCCGQPAVELRVPRRRPPSGGHHARGAGRQRGPDRRALGLVRGDDAARLAGAVRGRPARGARAGARRRVRRGCWRRSRARCPTTGARRPRGLPLLLPPAARPARHDLGPRADQLAAGRRARRAGGCRLLLRLRRDVRDQAPDVSTAMAATRSASRARGGRAELVSGDVGCLMHLGGVAAEDGRPDRSTTTLPELLEREGWSP